jgi:3-keto-5-aminohexanoate cleavage enzyme
MNPLVITATPNICWLQPQVPYPATTEAMVLEAELCREAGAAVLHMHAEQRWAEAINAVRDHTDMVIQCGMSSLSLAERMDVMQHGGDELSVILGHHDEAFAELDVHRLHPREELLEYCGASREYGVKLEFEVWNTGHVWNLNWLINRKVTDPPYITTLFFGWPGGQWSPPTMREYLYRREYIPESSVVTVSTMGPEQRHIMAAAIASGDHIRVGTEDYPTDRNGHVAPTHVLVQEARDLALAMGRQVATPIQARQLLGVPLRERTGR